MEQDPDEQPNDIHHLMHQKRKQPFPGVEDVGSVHPYLKILISFLNTQEVTKSILHEH